MGQREPGPQRLGLAAVGVVADVAHLAVIPLELAPYLTRSIRRSVIDDDDLPDLR